MASAVLGKVSPTPKGEYVSTQDYDRLDVVTYKGYPYLAKSNVPSGNLPTDELYWMPLLTGLDFAPGGYGLGEQTSMFIDPSIRLSQITTGGMYYWNSENTDPDKPFTSGELLVIPRGGTGYFDQIAFGKDATVPKVKIRQCLNVGSWSAWEDWSPSAFAPSGYGLGADPTYVSDANTCKSNGWFYIDNNTANKPTHINYAVLFVYRRNYAEYVQEVVDVTRGLKAIRHCYDGATWSEWAYENPPMQLGVEYRTTKRWKGVPVYTRLFEYGALPNNTQAGVALGVTDAEHITHIIGRYASSGGNTTSYPPPGAQVNAWGNNIYINATGDLSGWSAQFTIEYIKT